MNDAFEEALDLLEEVYISEDGFSRIKAFLKRQGRLIEDE